MRSTGLIITYSLVLVGALAAPVKESNLDGLPNVNVNGASLKADISAAELKVHPSTFTSQLSSGTLNLAKAGSSLTSSDAKSLAKDLGSNASAEELQTLGGQNFIDTMSAKLGFNKETTSEQVGEAFASNIQGKVVLVTGCSPNGLGAETARIAAKYGARLVILAGRRQSALEETAADIKKEVPNANLRLLIVDLSSLESVRAAAKQVLAYDEAIDVLVNNAGIMAVPQAKTVDGFESQLGTNYIGPFVFTNTILPKLFEASSPRIVNLTSCGHYLSPFRFDDPMFEADYKPWIAYGQSKTAFILYSKELTRRYHTSHNLSAFAVHPGVISTTNLSNNVTDEGNVADTILTYKGEKLFELPKVAQHNNWKDIPQGTSTQLVAAFDPSIVDQSGSYLCDAQVCNEAAEGYALDDANATKLWKWTEETVGQAF
ncbi:hypothetical protein BC940DRAFT_334980 [Gongronella butleri]|nr:hypothetical protein BC940DRAFT_334980 [Gongronella butleri]